MTAFLFMLAGAAAGLFTGWNLCALTCAHQSHKHPRRLSRRAARRMVAQIEQHLAGRQ